MGEHREEGGEKAQGQSSSGPIAKEEGGSEIGRVEGGDEGPDPWGPCRTPGAPEEFETGNACDERRPH